MSQVEGNLSHQNPEATKYSEPVVLQQMRKAIALRGEILLQRFPDKITTIEQETQYLTRFHEVGLKERIQRAEDLDSSEVQEANEIALRILRFEPFRIACIDERNKYEYVFGIPPGVGGDYRVPAGNPKEFVVSNKSQLVLLPNSNYAKALDTLLEKDHSHPPHIILDCHLDCAAQKLSESGKKVSLRREKYADNGLFQDVKRKIAISKAIRAYAEKKHPGKPIDISLTSYDPATNFIYMGMEQAGVMQYAEEQGGLTPEVLAELSQNKNSSKGKIISTAQIASDPRVQAVFDNHLFVPNWDTLFKETTKNYWQNVESIMQSEVVDIIKDQVLEIYPVEDLEKVENRVQLLLLNAYSGYLNNKAEIVVKKHNANSVIVSERQYGSFTEVSAFQVSSHSQSIPEDVHLANNIIEKNRENGTAKDFTQTFEDYRLAPNADMLQKIDRENSPIWEKLQNVDFSDLVEMDWRTMSENDFRSYLYYKYPEITLNACNILNYLREKAAEFLNPSKPTAQQIMEGDLHMLYAVTDTNRKPLFIFPLEYKGYSEEAA